LSDASLAATSFDLVEREYVRTISLAHIGDGKRIPNLPYRFETSITDASHQQAPLIMPSKPPAHQAQVTTKLQDRNPEAS
jgi:hypothetical protein